MSLDPLAQKKNPDNPRFVEIRNRQKIDLVLMENRQEIDKNFGRALCWRGYHLRKLLVIPVWPRPVSLDPSAQKKTPTNPRFVEMRNRQEIDLVLTKNRQEIDKGVQPFLPFSWTYFLLLCHLSYICLRFKCNVFSLRHIILLTRLLLDLAIAFPSSSSA